MSEHQPTIEFRNFSYASKRRSQWRAVCECGYHSGWQQYEHLAALRARDHVTVTNRDETR